MKRFAQPVAALAAVAVLLGIPFWLVAATAGTHAALDRRLVLHTGWAHISRPFVDLLPAWLWALSWERLPLNTSQLKLVLGIIKV